MRVAIIIPAHNEAATIARVVSGVIPYGTPIVVDDASRDGTGGEARRAGAVVVHHPVNLGYDGALESGFAEAARIGAEAVVTLDADGQHDPATVPQLLGPIERGEADLVLGILPRAARASEWVFNVYTLVRFGVPDILCGLKAYNMSLYAQHGRFGRTGAIGTELALVGLARGVRFQTVAVPIAPREGASRFGSSLRANVLILRALGRSLWLR